jgi:glycosyltransferase involved in cell wall biosynthesis
MKNIKLSVIIIAQNEEEMIGKAIESVKWADEVLVVDHGSSDNTAKIARKLSAKVVRLEKGEKADFSRARNFGLKHAHGEWVLYLDADERITSALREEIIQILEGGIPESYFVIPRENVIFGKVLKHGGWYPDYVKRLYRKEWLKKWEGDLHEEPVVEGEMGYLKNPMRHIKHETLSEMLQKTNNWSEIEAKLMFEAGHPPMNIPRFLTAMGREFWKRMIYGAAFLDGGEGIIMACYQVYSRFISYAKLWEMQESRK